MTALSCSAVATLVAVVATAVRLDDPSSDVAAVHDATGAEAVPADEHLLPGRPPVGG